MESMGTVLFLAKYPYGEKSKKCKTISIDKYRLPEEITKVFRKPILKIDYCKSGSFYEIFTA